MARKMNTYDQRERFINTVREHIFTSGRTYSSIARECNCSPGTIGRLARNDTRWPSYKTLFPLIGALGLELSLTEKSDGDNVIPLKRRA